METMVDFNKLIITVSTLESLYYFNASRISYLGQRYFRSSSYTIVEISNNYTYIEIITSLECFNLLLITC